MARLFAEIRSYGVPLAHFDIGGGIGVRYKNEEVFSPREMAEAIKPVISQLGCEIMFEPGRFLTANSGILAIEIIYAKTNRNKIFYVTDGAMTELIRPSLYSAYHHIQPLILTAEREDVTADIVGPVCESSDFIGKNRQIQKCFAGEKLAVMSAGAYGMVMASNYNGRRRPPEIMVDGDKFRTARGRETYEHLLWDEDVIDWQ
ncbi:MAG: diaminopimelate decarboxylase family protein, partial [Syntrophothermus sp.]